MIVDSHHHFWKYDPEQYKWIGDRMAAIRRDFLPGDLKAAIAEAGVDGVVSVQARQSLEETTWLLAFADEHDFIRGVVGWAPLTEPTIDAELERLAPNAKLKAIRHVVQGEPDRRFLLRDDFNRGVSLLAEHDLAYDILIRHEHLPVTLEFVDRHPEHRLVVDHIAKPDIAANTLEPWRTHMLELGRREHVYCKVSGMVTEADLDHWTEDQMQPYLDTVLEAFGPERLMFGSDWPVCLAATTYKDWFDLVARFAAKLSDDERARLMGGTAIEAYKL